MEVQYTPTQWQNRVVQRPRTYTEVTNQDQSRTDTPAPGTIIQAGTPLNENNMNHIEQGIKACADAINEAALAIAALQDLTAGHTRRLDENDQTDTAQGQAIDALNEAMSALQTAVNAHVGNRSNPHHVDFIQAFREVFETEWNTPDLIGTFTGLGSGTPQITVNGVQCRGNLISCGFAPSRVAIFLSNGETGVGLSEYQVFSSSNNYHTELFDVLSGGTYRVAVIEPGKNYWHSGCPDSTRTAAPQTLLGRNHGGAAIYGNGFIVQSYNNADSDTTMYINAKNVVYHFMAWR